MGSDSKIVIEQTRGKWIVEVAELSGLARKDIENIKAQITRQRDRARMSYEKIPTDAPRQFITIGTTNERASGGGYLKDNTGNRRFLPVAIRNVDINSLRRDIDQIWAEASHFENKGEEIILPRHLLRAATEHQEARRAVSPIEEVLREAIENLGNRPGFIPDREIYTLLGIENPSQRAPHHVQQVKQCMDRLGFEKKRRRNPSATGQENRVYGFQRGGAGDFIRLHRDAF